MRFWFLLPVVVLLACTSMRIDVLQPLPSDERYQKFLILAVSPTLAVEEVIESQMVKVFEQNNIAAVAKYTLIPGPQHLNPEQFNRLIAREGIDAILIVRPVGEAQNAPETSLTMAEGAYGLYNREARYLYESSDEWSRRNRKVYAQIIDIRRQRIVWYAYLSSKTWTTTEVALYTKVLRTAASDIAGAIATRIK